MVKTFFIKFLSHDRTESRAISFFARSLFFLIHLAIMTEIIAGPLKFRLFFRLGLFLWFTKPYLKTIKNRYYTYWSLSIILSFYLAFKVSEQFYQFDRPHTAIIYFLALLCLILNMFLLSSPIYYPIVSWWEYDFRFRDDLKIQIKPEVLSAISQPTPSQFEDAIQGRLTDLRRYAGCVSAFQEYKIGDQLLVKATDSSQESVILKGVVMSKRREYFGRPWNYGMQFKFDSRISRNRYNQLKKMWKNEKNKKSKLRFSYT